MPAHADLVSQGIAETLLSLVALCCLVITLVGMGLKLPWFRRQMRLGTMAHVTAAQASKLEAAASATNVPSQGVFRMWSIDEEGPPMRPSQPPPPPKRTEPKRPAPQPDKAASSSRSSRPKSVELPPKTTTNETNRPKTMEPPRSTESSSPVFAKVRTKSEKDKTKSAPPTRRNPNAPAFAATSVINKSDNKQQSVKLTRTLTPPPTATNPLLMAKASLVERSHSDRMVEKPDFLNVSNGHLPAPRSPVPVAKSSKPKVNKKTRKLKTTSVQEVQPIVQNTRPASVPATTSASSDFEETGVFTFKVPEAPKTSEVHPSFLSGWVADSDECDA